MQLTQTGIVLVPLTLLVFLLAPRRLGQWAIVVSAFGAASVLNIGGGFPVGVTPYFFAVALIAAGIVSRVLTGRLGLLSNEPIRGHVQALILFVGWAAASAVVLPVLFSGMPVDLGRASVNATYLHLIPLHWSFSNIGQAGYLVLDLCLVLLFLRNAPRPGYIDGLVEAFTWSGLIVVEVGAYQLLSYRISLPFPKAFLYSNPVWGQLAGENIGGWRRINATFPEASSAGDFLAMWSVFELVLAARGGRRGGRHWWFALAGSFMVVNTTSTTGYVALAVAWAVFIWKYVIKSILVGRVAVRALVGAALLLAAIAVALIIGGHGASLIDNVLLNKLQSGSAEHRLASIVGSVSVFTQSFGLGVGLGSDRALSAGAYILANLGVIGIVLFPVPSSGSSIRWEGAWAPSTLETIRWAFVLRRSGGP